MTDSAVNVEEESGRSGDANMGEACPDFRDEELLWRNVHPTFWDAGGCRPSSQAFKPTPKDMGKLSLARELVVTAEEHYREFTEDLGLESIGVWAVAAGECGSEHISLEYDDQRIVEPHPRGHTSAIFNAIPQKDWKKCARSLRDVASNRGRKAPSS